MALEPVLLPLPPRDENSSVPSPWACSVPKSLYDQLSPDLVQTVTLPEAVRSIWWLLSGYRLIALPHWELLVVITLASLAPVYRFGLSIHHSGSKSVCRR